MGCGDRRLDLLCRKFLNCSVADAVRWGCLLCKLVCRARTYSDTRLGALAGWYPNFFCGLGGSFLRLLSRCVASRFCGYFEDKRPLRLTMWLLQSYWAKKGWINISCTISVCTWRSRHVYRLRISSDSHHRRGIFRGHCRSSSHTAISPHDLCCNWRGPSPATMVLPNFDDVRILSKNVHRLSSGALAVTSHDKLSRTWGTLGAYCSTISWCRGLLSEGLRRMFPSRPIDRRPLLIKATYLSELLHNPLGT